MVLSYSYFPLDVRHKTNLPVRISWCVHIQQGHSFLLGVMKPAFHD